MCEVWRGDEERWALVDAQLDEFQRQALGIEFDLCDVPRDQFVPAGKAWQLCRSGQADPDRFGIFDMHGMWFIRGNLLRDLASLNKMQPLPWDSWGLMQTDDQDLSAEDMALLDRAAGLTLAGNEAFSEVRTIYGTDDRLHAPPLIRSHTTTGVRTIDITEHLGATHREVRCTQKMRR